MTAVLRDAYGLTVSTASRAAVEATTAACAPCTLLAAALRGRLREPAMALLERRLAKRPNPGHFWQQAAGRGAAEGEPSGYEKGATG
jgi:hypothetical protein